MKRVGALAALALIAGCNGLLDLDPAHVDPSIGTSSGGSAGANSAEAGATDAAGNGGQPGEPLSLCAQYCQAVTDGCVGDMAQYTDLDACLTECSYFPEGEPGDKEGNSINCRLGYALRAPS